MKNCPEKNELIQHIERELPENRTNQVQSHLDTCQSCARRISDYQLITEHLQNPSHVDVDDSFTTRVMNEVRYIKEREKTPDRHREQQGFIQRIQSFLVQNSSWMASVSLHGALFLLLTLFILSPGSRKADETANTQDIEQFDGMLDVSSQTTRNVSINYETQTLWKMNFRRNRLLQSEKRNRIKTNSGTPDILNTVDRGLRTLKTRQNSDGSWSHSSKNKNRTLNTALCTLAYLHAGHLPSSDKSPYAESVKKGINFLIEQQNANGRIGRGSETLRGHAAATTALLELVLLEENPRYYDRARNALSYLLNKQKAGGFWKIIPVNGPFPADSVSVWHVYSLRLGIAMGIKKASAAVNELLNGLELRRAPDSLKPIHLLCHDLFTPTTKRPAKIESFRNKLATGNNPYANIKIKNFSSELLLYSCAQFHTGGTPWIRWNQKLQETLPTAYRVKEEPSPVIAKYMISLQVYYSYPRA